MHRTSTFVLFFSCSAMFLLVLNGEVSVPGVNLPPLGRLLNPFDGLWLANTSNETEPIELTDERLSAKVVIYYDERRVPHIFAANLEDALFAQGFVEAQNRLFQMEFLAKASAGELSSMFGDRTLAIDLEKRRRGMKYAAENAVKGWEKTETYGRANRYVDGVNAYIQSLTPETTPLEFTLLQLEPEPWNMVKSALIFKQMSQTLAGRNDDVEFTNLRAQLGDQDFAFLYPERQTEENAVIPDGTKWQFDSTYTYAQDDGARLQEVIQKAYFPNREPGVGSNSWGLSGTKTATGRPIFCNDPHLSLGLPSIWFEVHIHTPEFNAYGVSFPGFPGIMIGFNEHIAWGETNVGQDVEDLFVIQWANPERTSYMMDGKEEKAVLRIEEIRVKGGATVMDTVRYTHWGPVYKTSVDGKHDLAMRWLCHDEPDTDEFNVFINAMACKNYDDYLHATEPYISPAQNFGFAAKDGEIAMRVNGRFPARPSDDGRFVEFGNTQANGWLSYIPKKQNPQVRNPERGFIASANQVSTDRGYPYYFTGKFEKYRNKTINNALDSIKGVTPADMQKMQANAYSGKAASMIRALNKVLLLKPATDKATAYWKMLASWDFQYLRDSRQAVLFELFMKQFREQTWDEITSLRKDMDVRLPEDWRFIEMVETLPLHPYFDRKSTSEKETAADIALQALMLAGKQLDSLAAEGKDTWGKYRPMHIYHLTRLPAFSVMDLEVDGCPDAINATGLSFGPSWRMVVSLEDTVRAWGVYPGGQSGNPLSPYYSNMIPAWQKGEYYAINLYEAPSALQQRATQTISLLPSTK